MLRREKKWNHMKCSIEVIKGRERMENTNTNEGKETKRKQ